MVKLVPDVVVPAGVFVADWATSVYDEKATGMKLNRPVGIGLAAIGYVGALLNWGGDVVKNIGIASFDWAANSVVSYFKERGGTSAQASSRMERIPVHARFGESRTVYPNPGEEVQVTVT